MKNIYFILEAQNNVKSILIISDFKVITYVNHIYASNIKQLLSIFLITNGLPESQTKEVNKDFHHAKYMILTYIYN